MRRRTHGFGSLVHVITFAALFIAYAGPCLSARMAGDVVRVIDGDTIVLLDDGRQQHKVRLSGIDAPERKQAFGEKSRQNLARLVFNKRIYVEWKKLDRYGRVIGKLLLNGSDINLVQIQDGLAWHYKEYAREQTVSDQRTYATAETRARSVGNGLWSESKAIPPWEFRRRR